MLYPAFSYFFTCCETYSSTPEETHWCWSPFWSSALWAVVSTYFEQKRWLNEIIAELRLCKLCREAMFLLWEHLWISPGEGPSRLSTMCQWQLVFLASRRGHAHIQYLTMSSLEFSWSSFSKPVGIACYGINRESRLCSLCVEVSNGFSKPISRIISFTAVTSLNPAWQGLYFIVLICLSFYSSIL